MPYSHESKKNGTTYYLHSKETESRGGKRTLFFFAKEVKEAKDGTQALDKVPDGYTVTESAQTGLPLLKREGEKKTEGEMTDSAKDAKGAEAKAEPAEKKPAAKKAPAKTEAKTEAKAEAKPEAKAAPKKAAAKK